MRRPDRLGQSSARQWLPFAPARRLSAGTAEAAKACESNHGICNRWPEKITRRIHPHTKPIGLISRLIGAVTRPGELVVDPAAGSFVVMRAARELGRNFIGCDIAHPA